MELNLIEKKVSTPPTKEDGEVFIVFCEGIGFVYARYFTGSKTWMSNETKLEIKPTFWYKKKKHYSEFPKGYILNAKSFSEQIANRRSGNTTREIDAIVNLLFNGYKAYCEFFDSNEYSHFLDKVIDRFRIEHKIKTISSGFSKNDLSWDFEKIKVVYKTKKALFEKKFFVFDAFGNKELPNEDKIYVVFEFIEK